MYLNGVWLGTDPKMGIKKEMLTKVIGRRANDLLTNINLIVNIMGGTGNVYDHLMSMRIFTLISNKIYSYKIQQLRGSDYNLDLDCYPTSH
jgi:hypothetical protein